MEGATRSGLMVADEIISRADGPAGLAAAHLPGGLHPRAAAVEPTALPTS